MEEVPLDEEDSSEEAEVEDCENCGQLDQDDLGDSEAPIAQNIIENIVEKQNTDRRLREMKAYIESSETILPEDESRARAIAKSRPLYAIRDGILLHLDPHGKNELRIVVPLCMQAELLQVYHDEPLAAHQGVTSTYDRLRKQFYWDGMYMAVVRYCESCDTCLRTKAGPAPLRTPLVPIPVGEIFERVSIDVCGPFPETESGNKFVIGLVDYLSRYALTIAVPAAPADTIAEFFVERLVLQFGAPSAIVSDMGTNMLSQVMVEICRCFRTMKSSTTAYHPQANSKCERFWGSLKSMLKAYADEDQMNWDTMLPWVTFAYNSGVRSGTGFSLYEVVFGRQPRTPFEAMVIPPKSALKSMPKYVKDVAECIKKTQALARNLTTAQQDKIKERYDKHA